MEVIAIYLAERMGGVLGYTLLLAKVKKSLSHLKSEEEILSEINFHGFS